MTTTISDPVRLFFEAFERNSNSLALEDIGAQYCEVFMFGSPQGARAVRREDLLKALPKRREFFKNLGLKGTTISAFEEKRLDDHTILVEAHLTMHFEKDPANPVDNEDSSTFILHQRDQSLQIMCHIEHDEAINRMRVLGLLPANP